ncbi:GNAT family N-acetyltransferase [Bacillus sp. 31A1R]|uniref:GNAT family N-acetyltransferase n=1 Tax=Robertmurraya mangrovi TaxID=3098077 RepID=A0ABU5IU23_9BACI|nr:GNAT family N-acetyltransferase [Bacillus sp. 31A1R]MDZ5470637.1 GNAT family N-acetyltransferase [Bacillus sp. 31A1R]
MVNGELKYRDLSHQDIPFFLELARENKIWREIELKGEKLENYIETYSYLNGEWRLWTLQKDFIGVSFHTKLAPSNGKPWFGTLIITVKFQKQGIGKAIIEKITSELKEEGMNVIFAGIPFDQYNWIDFLGKCSFEQFKIEKDDQGNSYLIMIRPIQ